MPWPSCSRSRIVIRVSHLCDSDPGQPPDDDGHTPGTGNAQDITDNLLGKILRIDVNGDDFSGDANRNYAIPPDNPYRGVTVGDDEVWAIGMRNPFRASFDRLTGDLWLGDVGQGAREEVDILPANSVGQENFGWRLREGSIATPTAAALSAGASLAPSPVTATTSPRSCSARTTRSLSSGAARA